MRKLNVRFPPSLYEDINRTFVYSQYTINSLSTDPMKARKQHSRASQKIPAPFMPPVKKSQMVAKEVEEMLRKHITDLGEFLESL